MIEFVDASGAARIKVVGIGGGGGNAVNTMIAAGLPGVDFIAANTDAQALKANLAPIKMQLGDKLTRGLGAGGNPEVGRRAAQEDVERLRECLADADMIFITAGMGGGTGTGVVGAAMAEGENRAIEAAQKAVSSPLLEEVSINGARGVLINITGGPDLSLHEVNEAATLIQEEADEDANIIFGAVIDESMGDEVRITVIATGFGEHVEAGEKPRPGPREGRAAGAGEGRPVKRLGLLAEDELDVPTWQRRRQEPPVAPRGAQRPAPKAGDGEPAGDYDVPTFLRRGAD